MDATASGESEDRGKAIPTKDRDRVIPKRLRLRGAMVKGLHAFLLWRRMIMLVPRIKYI